MNFKYLSLSFLLILVSSRPIIHVVYIDSSLLHEAALHHAYTDAVPHRLISSVESPLALLHDLGQLQPSILVGVPQLFIRIYDGIRDEVWQRS